MGLKLVAELAGDGSGFQRMMGAADARAKSFASSAIMPLKHLIAATFTVGAIEQLTSRTIEWAKNLQEVAEALGVNVEWLQRMQNGAKLAGADISDLEKFIMAVNRSREEAMKQPTGAAAKAFGRLGVSSGDITGLSTQDFMQKLIDAFKHGSTIQMQNDLQEVGSKSARNLLAAFFNQFESDIPVVSQDVVDQLKQIGDEFIILSTTLKVMFAPIIVDVVNTIIKAINILKVGFATIRGFLSVARGGKINIAEGVSVAEEAGFNEVVKQARENAMRDRMRSALTAQRTARENAPPQFAPLENMGKGIRSPVVQSDALVRVGNFLGSNAGLVNGIAQSQLETARRHLDVSTQMKRTLDQILSKIGLSNPLSTISIPQ